MYFVLLVSLFIAILLEATIVSLPLAFILLLCYSILNRSGKVFLSAFLIGIFLDLFKARPIGVTSLYFLMIFALLLLYQKKYEIKSYFFVIISTFIGSYFYLLLINGDVIYLQAVISSLLAAVIFAIGKKVRRKEVGA